MTIDFKFTGDAILPIIINFADKSTIGLSSMRYIHKRNTATAEFKCSVNTIEVRHM